MTSTTKMTIKIQLKINYKVPKKIYCKEKNLYVNRDNIGKSSRQGLHRVEFSKIKNNNLKSLISMYMLFLDTGNIMRGKKKLLGIL